MRKLLCMLMSGSIVFLAGCASVQPDREVTSASGWLGVGVQSLTEDLATKFGVREGKGVLINEVFPGDPADKAGLLPGDIIVKVNGLEVDSAITLSRLIAGLGSGRASEIEIIRGEKRVTFMVWLAAGYSPGRGVVVQDDTDVRAFAAHHSLHVQDLTPELAERFKLKDEKGILIAKVERGSPAEAEGLREGDLIKEVNREKVTSAEEFNKVVRKWADGESLLLRGVRENQAFFAILKLSMRAVTVSKEALKGSAQSQKALGPTRAPDASDIEQPAFAETQRALGEHDVAVVIGVEKYQDLPAADYAASDARLVKEYLVALGLKERNIQLLVDEKATQSSIKKTVETWLANRVKKESRVVVYYSGHGSPDPATGAAYIVPHDGDPNYLADTGYPLKNLYEKLGALPAAEVVVLLDACFSGAGGRSVLAKGTKPMVVTREGGALPPKMVVLAATQGAQISTSSAEKGHGLFTYHVLKALKDGKKDIVEIYQHIQPLVEDAAKALNVQQSPSLNPEPRLAQVRFRLRN